MQHLYNRPPKTGGYVSPGAGSSGAESISSLDASSIVTSQEEHTFLLQVKQRPGFFCTGGSAGAAAAWSPSSLVPLASGAPEESCASCCCVTPVEGDGTAVAAATLTAAGTSGATKGAAGTAMGCDAGTVVEAAATAAVAAFSLSAAETVSR